MQTDTEDLSAQEPPSQSSNEAMQVVLDIMEAGLERVSQIVHNISISDSASTIHKQSYDVNQCIEINANKLREQVSSRINVVLVTDELPAIYIDTYKINQLLANLLANAAEAISERGTITVHSKKYQGNIEVSVSDTGCGIDKHLQEMIFDPCFSTRKANDSTGLGLAISRDIAREHGGDLRVFSELGKGARFTLSFPVNDIIIH